MLGPQLRWCIASMDLRSELPFWTLKNGMLGVYPPLSENVSCDVAIVGGGITGSLVAFHLVKEGIDTVLIDKRDFGFGSTSASTGLLLYEIDIDLSKLITLVGPEVAVGSYKLCLDAIDKIEAIIRTLRKDCGFRRKKSLYVATRKDDVAKLKTEYATRRKYKFKLDFLTKRDLRTDFSLRAEAALLSPRSAQVDPYLFCHQLLQHCTRKGLRAFDRTGLRTYRSSGNKVILNTDRGHKINARRVVFASGYESQEYIKQKIVKLQSTYALVSEPIEDELGFLEDHHLWETARPYFYARSTNDKRVILGGEDVNFSDPVRRDALIKKKTRKLVKNLSKFAPGLRIEPAFSWAGTFGATKDGLPYIGEQPEFPGAYFALGYGGNGMTYSIMASEIIRDHFLGRENVSANYYRFDR